MDAVRIPQRRNLSAIFLSAHLVYLLTQAHQSYRLRRSRQVRSESSLRLNLRSKGHPARVNLTDRTR